MDQTDNNTNETPPKKKKRSPRAFSRILESLVSGDKDVSTIGAISEIVANRSLSSLLALFAVLNCMPVPPGSSVILGIPVVIIAIQLIFLKRRIWMPEFLANREVKRETLQGLVERALPWTLRVERFLRPRYWPFYRRRGDQFTGLVCLLLAIVVIIPIPLGNGPPAFAIFIIGLANSQKDGIWLAIGILTGIGSILLALAIVLGAAFAFNSVFF